FGRPDPARREFCRLPLARDSPFRPGLPPHVTLLPREAERREASQLKQARPTPTPESRPSRVSLRCLRRILRRIIRLRCRFRRQRLMREKLANQMPVKLIELFTNFKKGGLLVPCKADGQIVEAAQGFAHGNLKLLEAIRMRFGIFLACIKRSRAGLRVGDEFVESL